MTPSPLVSIVIPTFNRPYYLRKALKSVSEQTYSNIETLVIDGSTVGDIESIVDSFDGITYYRQQTDGSMPAKVEGYQLSNGDYIQFLDDDDQLHPDKIAAQVDLLERNSNMGVAYCGYRRESGFTAVPHRGYEDTLAQALSFRGVWRFSTLLIESDLLDDGGVALNSDATGAGDIRLRIELAQRTEFGYVPRSLVLAGEPDGNLDATWTAIEARKALLTEYAHLYAQHSDVHQTALAEFYRMRAQYYDSKQLWSSRAIKDYARAVRFERENRILRVGELAASILGTPGRRLGQAVLSALPSR